MKLAVTYENNEVFQHFGHTPAFKIYDIKDGKVINSEIVQTNGTGHGALAGFLKTLGVTSLICGGIGGGAIEALENADILVYGGVSGSADKCVESLLAGCLEFNTEATCSHHDNDANHKCGEHGCGNH